MLKKQIKTLLITFLTLIPFGMSAFAADDVVGADDLYEMEGVMSKNILSFFNQLSSGSAVQQNIWALGTVQHIFLIFNADGYFNLIGSLSIVGIGLGLIAAAAAIYSLIAIIYFPFWLFSK